MAHEVTMPQMGESIAEGTITTWLKKVGEHVERDEPLFEISTDKVDAEIPSPAAGVLREIKVQPGQTVPINTVVALLEEGGATAEAPSSTMETRDLVTPEPRATAREPVRPAGEGAPAAEARGAEQRGPVSPEDEGPTHLGRPTAEPEPQRAARGPTPPPAAPEDGRRVKSSPVVRKIAAEHGVDVAQLEGSGISGRVTKQDILDYIGRPAGEPEAPRPPTEPAPPLAPVELRGEPIPEPYRPRVLPGDRVEEMSTMRSRIAEHMVLSRRISAHVNTVWDVDMTRIASLRDKYKESWRAQHGVPLTYTAFIMKATIDALKAFPVVNASVDGNRVIYHRQVNLGLAVALDWGLIVPVIQGADELNLLGLARHASDLAERARQKRLKPDEVQNGTFTITNPGIYGPLFNLPVINQPQVGILGVGAVEKRPVVIEDMLAIRTRCYLSLSFDHRIVDGATADQFMRKLHDVLVGFEEAEL